MSITAVKQQFESAIRDGMARALWLLALSSWGEENGYTPPGRDWDDTDEETPEAAFKAADDLIKLYAESENLTGQATPMAELFELAMTADRDEAFEFDPGHHGPCGYCVGGALAGWKCSKCGATGISGDTDLELAEKFGSSMASEAVGSGSGWGDDHETKSGSAVFDPATPSFECNYDGEDLSWSGVTRNRPQEGQRPAAELRLFESGQALGPRIPGFIYPNETDESMTRGGPNRWRTYLMRFRDQYFVIYAQSEGDASDELIDWVSENLPDAIADEAVGARLREELIERDIDPDEEIDWDDATVQEADEAARVGYIGGGNASEYVDADDISFVRMGNVTRDELIAFARERGFIRAKPKSNPRRVPKKRRR